MIRHIPEDVLWNILICLPAKQVAQMRCVSKPWNALLSQPSFIKSHLDHHLTHDDEILLVFISGAFSTRYPVTAHPSRSPILQLPNLIKQPKVDTSSLYKSSDLIGSANGLICFSSSETVVHIWNPSLSALATLPDIDYTLDANDHMQFRFGYDPINDDYKVVKVMFRLGGSNLDEIQGSIKMEVYSLKRGGFWQSVNGFPSNVSFICNIDEVCIDGHLYWNCYVNATRKTIVDFDLGAETFSEISLPDSISYHVLGVLFQKLCLISCYTYSGCEVWLLMDHKWVKHNVISQLDGSIEPIGFTSKNEFLFTTGDSHLALYDPDAAAVRLFSMNTQDTYPKVVEYVESLVWPPSLRVNMEN
ncbi:F-box domain containing protein [Tanacetum coccineum]